MNKKLTLSALALLLAAGVAHGSTSGEKTTPVSDNIVREKVALPVLPNQSGKQHNPSVMLAQAPRVLDSLQNAFSMYSTDQRPIVWTPSLNKLSVILRGAQTPEVDQTDNLNNLFLYHSENLGESWSAKIGPLNTEGESARYPSLLPIVQGPEVLFFYNYPITSGTGWGQMGYGVVLESDPSSPAALSSSGIQKGSDLFPWGSGALMSATSDNSKILIVATVSAPTALAGTANNNIGLRILDVNQFTVKEFIPDQWSSDKFADPGNTTSRTSTVAGIETKNGKSYVGAFGRFNNSENPATPTVGVSVSNDQGETWSEFDILPESVKKNYAAQNGAVNADSVLFTFNTATDFVVTGDDSFSFLTTLIESGPAAYSERLHDIVEIYKEGGQWGMRKVADVDMTAFIPMQLYANATDGSNPDSLSTNQRGNEAQLAISADGTKLVAKWLDWRGSLVYETVLPEQGDGEAPDTVNVSDIFIAAREIASPNWSAQPTNLTDDNFIDKVTWIPPVVPNDLKNIPLFMVQSSVERNTNPTAGDILDEMRIISIPQYVVYTTFDASVAVSVNEASVQEGRMLGIAAPNPASSVARINYSLPTSGYVSIDLYNAMGQKVMPLFNGQAEAGVNYVDVNTQNLPVGSYYYRLHWNGKTETRMLNVVR